MGLSWPVVRAAVTAQTAALLPAGLAPVQVLGIAPESDGINRAVELIARSAYGFRTPENERLRTHGVTSRVTVPDRVRRSDQAQC